MKGQNCEARFTYRGFSVGSTTVQIRQGSNTVAQLTLTASTDPRIASINFPCGDLSAATTLRVQQATASLTGTNELSGLYLGLATNQANVAQAELVGTWTMSGATNCSFSTTSTSYGSPSNYSTADADCNNPVVTGDIISKGKVLGFDLPAKPGKYVILVQAPMRRTAGSFGAYFRLSDGTTNSGNQLIYSGTSGEVWSFNSITLNTEYSTAGTKTFFLDGKVDGPGSGAAVENAGADNKVVFLAYRFPTSSELVVTPERQNVWGAYQFTGASAIDLTNTATGSWQTFSNAAAATITAFGSASTSKTACTYSGGAAVNTNDVAICMPVITPGTYKVTLQTRLSSVGAGADCTFRFSDGATGFGMTNLESGLQNNTLIGIIKYNALTLNRGIRVESFKPSGTSCNLLVAPSSSDRIPQFIFEPLDQPSNSALYVQGPVLGAQTGAAIPAGYQGEIVYENFTITTTSGHQNAGSFSFPPGVYRVMFRTQIYDGSAGSTTVVDSALCVWTTTNACAGSANGKETLNSTLVLNSGSFGQFRMPSTLDFIVRSNGSTLTMFGSTFGTGNTLYFNEFYSQNISVGGRYRYIYVQRIN
jgi:hypothetical protein